MTIATTGQLPTEANAFVNLALPYVLVRTLSVHRSAAKARAGLVTKIFVATASPTSRSIGPQPPEQVRAATRSATTPCGA
jgi:hypothetical protein